MIHDITSSQPHNTTEVVAGHGEFEMVLAVLQIPVLSAQLQTCIVDEHVQLLTTGVQLGNKLANRLEARQVDLNQVIIITALSIF